MNEQKCLDCAFWLPKQVEDAEADVGECRRNAPSVVTPGTYHAIWPRTWAADGCHEGKERKSYDMEFQRKTLLAQDIANYYNEKIASQTIWYGVRKVTVRLRSMMKARWRECKFDDKVLYEVIDIAASSDFLMHQKSGEKTMAWLMGPKNFGEILNGKYASHTAEQKMPEAGNEDTRIEDEPTETWSPSGQDEFEWPEVGGDS